MTASPKPVRIAVIGAGRMGQNHLRCYGRLAGCQLVAAVDPSGHRHDEIRAMTNAPIIERLVDLPPVDAVSIATPSTTHVEIAEALISAGVHCLIEKPLALDAAEGERLAAFARRRQVKVAVGHLERFNPAFQALEARRGDLGRIHALTARRMGRVARIVDVDVIDDLMVHDIDLILALTGADPGRVQIDGLARFDTPDFHHATAIIELSDQMVATVTASHLSPIRFRRLDVVGEEAMAVADLITQTLTIRRPTADGGIAEEIVTPPRREPLYDEIADFLDAIREDRAPRVTPESVLATLAVTDRLRAAKFAMPRSAMPPS